jgi:hypothetical protein
MNLRRHRADPTKLLERFLRIAIPSFGQCAFAVASIPLEERRVRLLSSGCDANNAHR